MTTDTSEKGLESLIVAAMTGPVPAQAETLADAAADVSSLDAVRATRRRTWILGDASQFNREHALDLEQLRAFMLTTQKDAAEALDLYQDSPTRRKFLARLQGEIAKRGVIDVLRKGIEHGKYHLDLFYGTPSPGNRQGRRALRRQPLQRHPPAPLQPRRDAACARSRPLHQRPADRHLRAEEQPDQADGRRRHRSSTNATATRASCSSSSGAASCTSPSMTTRCGSART